MDTVNAVRFVLDGEVVSATNVPPTMTVLEYLRDVAHRTGTKEGCAEGDCGACTVAVGELAADGSHIRYRAINSCIRMLPSIDGQELVTVESLQAPDGTMHPVQQAMIDCHGSQCGFCTPGFVMSLFALYLQEAGPSRQQVLTALSGNLCRCTGYRPIIEAGCRMGGYPTPQHWAREAAQTSDRCKALSSIQRRDALQLPGWHAPRSIDELATALVANPSALVLAGGTDVGLWLTKQLRELPAIVYVGDVAELKRMQRSASGLVIGAGVCLSDAWDHIVRDWPQLRELAERFGSPPVRNSGTLGGNLANGSPIGDSMPVLIALGAQIELRCGSVSRRLPLEQFYLGYQRKDLHPGEFLVSITIPLPQSGLRVASYKLSKRIDQDISAVCAAFAVRVEQGKVSHARIVFGGMAAVPSRAAATENRLLGSAWTQATIDSLAETLAQDFQPLTDMRASSAYRLQSAANLLHRFYLEISSPGVALRTSDALMAAG